jgi:4a-hydroxytetrahydrobiopterin dehydratase
MMLTREAASTAVSEFGWRYLLGSLRAAVPVRSLGHAVEVLRDLVEAAGDEADGHLFADVRVDQLVLTLQTFSVAELTEADLALARRLTAAARELGLAVAPIAADQPVQTIEVGIDALDIAAIRPFWMAVLGYVDEADRVGPTDPVIDPRRQGPSVWFQQMDAPRPQRNRIHFDVSVTHDEAPARLAATLAAGGRLLSDERAPAFWVLADPEGNEACICTWQGRD